MPGSSKNSFSFIAVLVIGLIGLVILAVYLSSHDSFISLNQFSIENGFSTTTDALAADATSTDDVAGSGTASATTTQARKTMAIIAPHKTIIADVSNTEALRDLGLSGRSALGADRGMIFIFPKPGVYGFWMKDMKFPLDMVWIDSSSRVVGVNAGVLPESYPATFFPPKNIQFVLELNAGAAQRFGIATGTPLKFVL